MTMQIVVCTAFAISLAVCLLIGVLHSRRVESLADVLPLLFGREAKVASFREFSASTVAASISMATVLVAFYELVPALGLWLLWPAVTTAAGLAAFALLARRVWRKLSTYEFRPTLHAYLGTEFASGRLAMVASIFTAIGYLTAFAVELTVSARFLMPLLPGVSAAVLVSTIAIVSFVYTGLGGFRTVVVTDRLQMAFIWLLLAAICLYYAIVLRDYGISTSIQRIPADLRSLSWTTGRGSFVLGILVMNLLTYIGNMGLWQRIAGSEDPGTVAAGLRASVVSSATSWSLLALVALGSFMLVKPVAGENLLITTMKTMQGSPVGLAVIFCVVLGLLGAMLSTASTQLMAVSHTVYEDILAPFRKTALRDRVARPAEVWLSRVILTACALVSVGVVEGLRAVGFSVADMAFAVYGAALGLVPPILVSLYFSRAVTSRLSVAAMAAVTCGFLSCWIAATYGRIHGDGNLVFLSPIVSTLVASVLMAAGLLRAWITKTEAARIAARHSVDEHAL